MGWKVYDLEVRDSSYRLKTANKEYIVVILRVSQHGVRYKDCKTITSAARLDLESTDTKGQTYRTETFCPQRTTIPSLPGSYIWRKP